MDGGGGYWRTRTLGYYIVVSLYMYNARLKNHTRPLEGRSQNFSKGGGGGHTGSNIIVMAFSPRNIVGCLLKKRLTKGGSGPP